MGRYINEINEMNEMWVSMLYEQSHCLLENLITSLSLTKSTAFSPVASRLLVKKLPFLQLQLGLESH